MPTATNIKQKTNAEIADMVRNMSSTLYQQRVPSATKNGIKATMAALEENRPLWNEFVPTLLNQIGKIIARNNSWTNELAQFKTGMLTGGSTIEEYQFELLKAHTYVDQEDYGADEIFKRERPIVHSSFHTINRAEYYKTSVNSYQLKRALLGEGEVTDFIGAQIATLSTSDNLDEFLAMISLLNEYENNGGFRRVKVPDLSASNDSAIATDARRVLATMRTIFDTWHTPSNKWNAGRVTSWETDDSKMMILCRPSFKANLDVHALAAAFNLDKAEVTKHFVTIPDEHMRLAGTDAILTTSDFFVCADSVLETQAQNNVVSLDTNYFLHHLEVLSASRFVPAVALGRTEDAIVIQEPTVTSVAKPTVTSMITGAAGTTVNRGEPYTVSTTVNVSGGGRDLMGTLLVLEGNKSDRTVLNQNGYLHIDIAEKATKLKITALSTADDTRSNFVDLTVAGELVDLWPKPYIPIKTPTGP